MTENEALIAAYPATAAATALLAGLVSSVSPCTVAAVPLVIGYVGGYAGGSRRRAISYSAAFAFGMALAFTAIGLAVALAGAMFLPTGGFWRWALIVLALAAGISLLSDKGLPGLGKAQCGATAPRTRHWRGMFGAFVTGALSGFVFAPCATPVMVGILALIGNQQDVVFGTGLMLLYSLGHSALLLAAGSSVGFAQWVARSRWAGRINWLFTRAAGGLLVGYALYLAAEILGWL
ncbi:cytochrome c biogenesis CcdA family protein [Sulfuricystis multivorans]|uniref:cytochrome c biogenesis CcdA family protein n=1 Tax=Sulfuricystis multivorans TaxID=2211108 RepID=UPI000F849B09|nr:cytochrome c biogenesis CcdA family protein [Sulfuricystis multivorans]